MNSPEYQVAERRPIATRELAISQRAAAFLAARGATANGISTAGMVSGIFAGVAFAATTQGVLPVWLCWVLGAVFVQLRLLANMLDGMVAVQTKQASAVGELFNEVPDRVSDAATLIGLGYAVGSHVVAGYIAACVAIFVAYVRAMGKVAGAHQEFCGPMAKPQRMATITVVSLICTIIPAAMRWHLPAIALIVIIIGGVLTSFRRLSKIAKALRAR